MGKKIIVFSMLLYGTFVSGQNYKFQALYLFNISQNIEWPTLGSGFTIGVIGSNDMANELLQIFKTRKVAGQPVSVKPISNTTSEIETCQLVYVARGASSKLETIATQIHNKPVLLVSDKIGLTGAGINMIDNSSKLEFEIFPTVIKQQGLKVGGTLLKLGIVK